MKEKILITGIKGFIGQYVKNLVPDEYELLSENRNMFQVDMQAYMKENKPDYLIHLAWVTGNGYVDSPDNLRMVAKSIEMYEAFYAYGGKRAVFVGTEQEYERSDEVLTETSPLKPMNLYAKCKGYLGDMLVSASQIYQNGFVWARLFFVYGYGEKSKRLMPSIITGMLNGDTVTCSCENYVRDYIHVQDVASAILTCLFSDYTGTVNICGGTQTTIGQIGNILQNQATSTGRVIYRSHEECKQPMKIYGSNELLRSLGWVSQYTLENGLKEEYDRYRGK